MKLYTIDTGYFKLDGGAMFGVVPKSIWNRLNPADENNLCNWALRCLLIEDGKRLILVDTGTGNKQDAKFFSYYFLHGNDTLTTSLAKHGFTPNDITDVFLTHLHFDHCGGAISREGDRLVPTFKNAVYWSNKRHWQWAVEPNAREKASFLKENILPIQESGQLQFLPVGENNAVLNSFPSGIADTFSVITVNGHTDAMMLPVLQYKNNTIVYMADLLPSVAHLPVAYIMGYDMFPLTTLQEKQIFLQEAADKNYTLFFEHDPAVECCTVQKTEKGVRVKETYKLSEL